MEIHAPIPVFKCFVKQEFLYDLDQSKTGIFIPCEVYGVSSYKNQAITFKIRLRQDGALFDYIPPHALLAHTNIPVPNLELNDLVYGNSPDWNISVRAFRHLNKYQVLCYFRHSKEWIFGEYVCTIDWYKDNENSHLIALDNGQYAFLPNHKCLFGRREKLTKELKPYKAIQSEWIIK